MAQLDVAPRRARDTQQRASRSGRRPRRAPRAGSSARRCPERAAASSARDPASSGSASAGSTTVSFSTAPFDMTTTASIRRGCSSTRCAAPDRDRLGLRADHDRRVGGDAASSWLVSWRRSSIAMVALVKNSTIRRRSAAAQRARAREMVDVVPVADVGRAPAPPTCGAGRCSRRARGPTSRCGPWPPRRRGRRSG